MYMANEHYSLKLRRYLHREVTFVSDGTETHGPLEKKGDYFKVNDSILFPGSDGFVIPENGKKICLKNLSL